jgi:hypothetical protein
VPVALIALVDAVCIVVFVALGRGSHSEGAAITGTLFVAAPFLIAAAIGWIVQTRRWSDALSRRFFAVLWATTLVVGMLLRRTVFDRGIAVAFVIVAGLFLALFLGGWRELARRKTRVAIPVAHD